MRSRRCSLAPALAVISIIFLAPPAGFAQADFSAQLRGTVQDTTGAVIPNASLTITNDATQVPETLTTDASGRYIFISLQPARYTVRVTVTGFKTVVRPNVELRVGQQTDLDFRLEVGEVTTTLEVAATAPVLNSVSAALGQEVTNRYITEVPLLNRAVLNLAYLAPGVTEVQGGSGGTNFVSNGQRNATAEVRLDGALTSSPEGGEGGTTSVKYNPSIEIVQEFKLQNNSFSAEFGNNGGTVINIITNSGTNEFHGSGFWFGRRPELDANNFFANRNGVPKAPYSRHQYGGSIGGPIRKQKAFFFFDYDRVKFDSPSTVTTTVPTAVQSQGDFSGTLNANGTLQRIFNPFDTYTDPAGVIKRRPFDNNRVPASMQDPIATRVVQLYPGPTGSGDPITARNNFTQNIVNLTRTYQYDIKIDHVLTDKTRLMGRYSMYHPESTVPPLFLGGQSDVINTRNAVVEHSWAPNGTTVWTNRIGVDRFHERRYSQQADSAAAGFPSLLTSVYGIPRFPSLQVEGYQQFGRIGSSSPCCTDTVEAHLQYMMASSLFKVVGAHNLKFGGEQRIFFNNFFQPGNPTGLFTFNRATTMEAVFQPNSLQGNGLAALLLGFGSGGSLGIQPSTANKSKETAFFVQDDWRVTQKLTLNLGLRYEWSTPFTDRYNRLQVNDYAGDSGIEIPGLGRLRGISRFTDSDYRTIGTDHNNLAPRLGLAYRVGAKTVVRVGAGLYYGFSGATNYQQVGAAFRKTAQIRSSLDGGITRYATLANPFPDGLIGGQGTKYGPLAMWGFSIGSGLSDTFRNAEIYQWNFGVQRELPSGMLVEATYSASRTTHLPFGGYPGTRNRNFIGRAGREQWGSRGLAELVPNPFLPLFKGPNAIFSEPDSLYNNATIPRINLLRPYPQFNGGFEGLYSFDANARYNSLQLRFEKRYSHGLNLLAAYTLSKLRDDSSLGYNGWMGNTPSREIQDRTNLKGEWSVGASDTPHRLVAGGSYEVPVGRGRHFGNAMHPVLNAVVGGWQINGFLTFQSGPPLSLAMNNARLADGGQRPNVTGNPRGADIRTVVDRLGNFFNQTALSDPGDQIPGNAPRYSDDLRADHISGLDFSFFKNVPIREKTKVQLRAEFFNFTNTPRFSAPNAFFGSVDFGTITSQYNSPRRAQMGVRFLF